MNRYGEKSHQCSSAHDKMVGVSAALSTTGAAGGEIIMTLSPIRVPRFNLPSAAAPNGEYLPTMEHVAVESAVRDAHADWRDAVNRLVGDPEANVADLIGPEAGGAS
jgi:hypothetical protein